MAPTVVQWITRHGQKGSIVELDITTEAVDWVRDRGGTAAIDFIPPIG